MKEFGEESSKQTRDILIPEKDEA
jgi:hypothetical protein